MFQVVFSENDRQIILAGLDLLARNLGQQINQAGGSAARDGAMKLIAVDNTGRLFANPTAFGPTKEEGKDENKNNNDSND